MSYEHKSNINKKKIRGPIKIILIICALILLTNIAFPTLLTSISTAIIRPFWGKEIKQGISVELRDTIILQLQNENAELKKSLGRNIASSTVMAYIIKKPPYTAYDIYIIDIGKDENIKIGDKVFSIGNVLLGEVAEVNGNTSKVKLYSSYGEKFDITIGKNIQATANGKGGGTFEVILPRDTQINEGDIVSSPNIHVSVFGIVRKIIIDPAKTFYTVLFSQPVNIYEQKIVLIEKTK